MVIDDLDLNEGF